MARPISATGAIGGIDGTTSRMRRLADAGFLDYVSATHGGLRRVMVDERLTDEPQICDLRKEVSWTALILRIVYHTVSPRPATL